ncbi:hypothetical protein [Paenibacillus harenae]|uniref:hypothetical protein n=1 Tax=Paenibacillus harenae TaxID=306543 RepID=UPI0003F7F83C|nr:hypothetical protein [Paenibacillus harenae]
MGNDFYRKLGAVFLVAAAVIYTIERIGWRLANAIEVSSGLVTRAPITIGFFDNLFVPAFSFVGCILFIYGFPRKN